MHPKRQNSGNMLTVSKAVFKILLIFLEIRHYACQDSSFNGCSAYTSCSSCISSHPTCVWCKTENSMPRNSRCDTLKNFNKKKNCLDKDIVNPQSGILVKDESAISQLTPQMVSLTLRPGSARNITVKFKESEDYPMDLYYLMDLSYTMTDDKHTLENLGIRIGEKIEAITKDFRIGFGSFVDKNTVPFTNFYVKNFLESCSFCEKSTYGYRHKMSLSNDIQLFINDVKASKISGNCDIDEGTLDAIMQAIVCPKIIGWRQMARKLLLVVTDAKFHIAGDGKLGGIVIPNDGLCHLDSNGEYTQSTNQDYPSIRQINDKVKQNNITVIFAVTRNAMSSYSALSGAIEGSYVTHLESDSSNIVNLITDQYMRIKSRLELKDNSPPNVAVTYYSRCLSQTHKKSKSCEDIQVGKAVEFQVEVSLLSCPANPENYKQTFHISPVGLSESITVELNSICSCDCATNSEILNTRCTSSGTYECGICKCYGGKIGEFCQCDASLTDNVDEESCKRGNSSIVCSGRGICNCGVCNCNSNNDFPEKKIYGHHCECDNYSCNLHNGLPCGGRDHGKCDCGQCKCSSQWSGSACGCSTSQDSCLTKNKKVCNEKGTCECGRCNCTSPYIGELCEDIFQPSGRCLEYYLIAQCEGLTERASDNNCDTYRNYTYEKLPELNEADESKGQYKCSYRTNSDCNFNFLISLSNPTHIVVQEKNECSEPVNVPVVAGSVIGTVLAIGIALLLIWKCLITIHDKREFAKFKKEIASVKWAKNQNPLFTSPSSRYSNPMYWKKLQVKQ